MLPAVDPFNIQPHESQPPTIDRRLWTMDRSITPRGGDGALAFAGLVTNKFDYLIFNYFVLELLIFYPAFAV
jgi:hypothetical protein